jgi:hypothetical protein
LFRIQRGQGLQPHGGRCHYMPRPADPDILRPLLQPVGGQHGFTLPGHAPTPREPLDGERLISDGRSEVGFGENSARGGHLNRSFYPSCTAGAPEIDPIFFSSNTGNSLRIHLRLLNQYLSHTWMFRYVFRFQVF